jgi:hypothetical protein
VLTHQAAREIVTAVATHAPRGKPTKHFHLSEAFPEGLDAHARLCPAARLSRTNTNYLIDMKKS